MGGEVSTDFKSSNRIEISRLVQVLLNFDWFWGPPGRWGWVDGGGGGERVPPCMCTHTHTCMYDIIQNSQGLPQWRTAICMKLSSLPCMHVHMCGGHPQPPSTPIHPAPYPQSCREHKTPKFNKSWTNRDNLILFEDSLPLNTPELIETIVRSPQTPPTHLPHPPEPRKPKSQELQQLLNKSR